jgi:hypothetical protein
MRGGRWNSLASFLNLQAFAFRQTLKLPTHRNIFIGECQTVFLDNLNSNCFSFKMSLGNLKQDSMQL